MLVDIRQVKVKINVPEEEIAKIKVGQTLRFSVSSLPGETFTARTGATLDANTVEYLDAQLSMIQDSVRASLHLSDLTRGEIASGNDLPELMRWIEGLACIKMLHDDHKKEREPQ